MYDIIQLLKKNPKKISYQKKIERNFGWKEILEKDKAHNQ